MLLDNILHNFYYLMRSQKNYVQAISCMFLLFLIWYFSNDFSLHLHAEDHI